MTAMLIEIEGEGAIAATEELWAIGGMAGSWEVAAGEVERGEPITTIATVVAIVGGTVAVSEQIRKWYGEYRKGKAGKRIEKVMIVGRNGRRLLLENATLEEIQRILND